MLGIKVKSHIIFTRGCAPYLRTALDDSPRFMVSGKQEEQAGAELCQAHDNVSLVLRNLEFDHLIT